MTTFHTPGALQDTVALHKILLPLFRFGGIDLHQALTSKHSLRIHISMQIQLRSLEHVSSGFSWQAIVVFSRMLGLNSWPASDIHPVIARTDLLLLSNPARFFSKMLTALPLSRSCFFFNLWGAPWGAKEIWSSCWRRISQMKRRIRCHVLLGLMYVNGMY